jgi:hypothetical protein
MEQFKYNFLRELKQLNIINNYVFFIEYNTSYDDQGYLIIGKKPHELYDKNKYKYEYLKEIYALNMNVELYWMMRFDSIYIKDKNGEKYKNNILYLNATIEHNLNIIFGTYEFMEIIEKEFFEEKINNNLCKKNYLINDIINYECELLQEQDIVKFPSIYFEHKNLLYVFELNFEDIFIKYDNRYICLIWFDMKNKNKWRLGKSFLKKYLFTFDLDRKIIGFYNPNIDDGNSKKSNDKDEENDNDKVKYIIIIIIALSIIAFVLCFLLAKYMYNNRKIIFNNDKKIMELTSMDNAPFC